MIFYVHIIYNLFYTHKKEKKALSFVLLKITFSVQDFRYLIKALLDPPSSAKKSSINATTMVLVFIIITS